MFPAAEQCISGFSPESSVIKIIVLAGLLACFTVTAFPFYQWQLDNSFLEAYSYGDSIGL
jgi:hypothetical protein